MTSEDLFGEEEQLNLTLNHLTLRQSKAFKVDMSEVQTNEDLRMVFRALVNDHTIFIDEYHPRFEELKPYLLDCEEKTDE